MTLQSFLKAFNGRLIIRYTLAFLFIAMGSQTLACLYSVHLFEVLQESFRPTTEFFDKMSERESVTVGTFLMYKYYTMLGHFIGILVAILIATRTVAKTKVHRAYLLLTGILVIVVLRFTMAGLIYQAVLVRTPGKFFMPLFVYLLFVGVIQLAIGFFILLKKTPKTGMKVTMAND